MEKSDARKEKGELDYQKYGADLSRLFEATANLLEREWPAKYKPIDSARVVFFQSIRIAINTFNTIMFISADTPKDPLRKPAFALSLAPLTRTLFEQLITFVFMIEDIPTYIPWLFKTGYTEYRIELEHCLQYHVNAMDWQPYIKELKAQIAKVEKETQLTADEISNPRKNIGRWPTPGGMLHKLKREHSLSQAIPFIEYLNSWLYRELSGQTHLNATGVTMRGSFFDNRIAEYILGEDWEEKLKDFLLKYRAKQIYISVTLMLAIASEIEIHFNFGRNEKARYLWAVFSEHSDITKDFWDTRYSALLRK
ncbi:MAG: hypothetical protein QOK48_1779 [Blastocatellia bacterium]|jgi:hypothetical protein|nr:hypothetical protein [Blastocatellia bacterium]